MKSPAVLILEVLSNKIVRACVDPRYYGVPAPVAFVTSVPRYAEKAGLLLFIIPALVTKDV